MIDHMLTTIDNPFDPFDQFDLWLSYDTSQNYHSLSFLARVTVSSPDLSENDQRLANELAIDEIISENVLGIYKKVSRDIDVQLVTLE